MRELVVDAAVIGRDERAALADRETREPAVGGELEADEGRVEAVHGSAPQHAALAVVQIAIGRVRLQEGRHLVGKALQHRGQLQLAAHDLRRAQERRALAESLAVLTDQMREAEGQADFDGDRLQQRKIRLRPRAGGVSMRDEHAELRTVGAHRRRSDGTYTDLSQPPDVGSRQVRRIVEIDDRDRSLPARSGTRDDEVLRFVRHPLDGVLRPLRDDRLRAVGVDDDEATARPERAPGFGDGGV